MSNQERKLAAIVYTDIAGFSELSASDENHAIELVNKQRDIIQPIVATYNGSLHKEIGDGFLLTFPTATSAVEFSIDFQRAIKHIDGLNVRIGIHEGEITVQNDDVFGDDVNIGARIEPFSPIGGIAISEKVKLEIGSLPEYQTEFISEPELRGIKQSVKIYCISSHGLVSSFKTIDDSVVYKDKRSFRFNVLSLTGIVLMIIGGIFWAWYGLGDFTHGSGDDLASGIKKSVAVFNFVNLTGKKDGDFFCSGISEGLRSALTRFAKLDVKSRHASLNKNTEDFELDYYVEGSLSEMGKNRNITVSLVSAKSGSNIWNDQYEFIDKDVVVYQDTIINNILTELNIDPSLNEFTSNKSGYKNAETFQLLGEGIYHFDNKNYSSALTSFDSVLELEPENMVANFHKANTYFKLNNYNDAMNLYKKIISLSIDVDHIDWKWALPEQENYDRSFCSKIEIIDEKDLAIIFLKGNEGSLLMGFNLVSRKIVWESPVFDKFVDNPIVNNNMVFLASSRIRKEQAGTPALYAYDALTGWPIYVTEFPRDYENQAVLIKIIEEYSSLSNDNSTILLVINKTQLGLTEHNNKELALIETATGSVLWTSKLESVFSLGKTGFLNRINTGNTELLVIISDKDIISLNNKTGAKIWSKNFSSVKNHTMYFWNKKILVKNRDENYVALWNPVTQKEEWKYYNKNDLTWLRHGEFYERMGDDVILLNFTNGDLVAINFDGGFFNWSLERWTQHFIIAEKLWFQENAYNRAFYLTKDDSLFTINLDNGEIINHFATNRHDYNIYYDDSKNAQVLHGVEYLIGVDPKNGDQLWKIKDTGVDQIGLIKNSVLAIKTVPEDSISLINVYNRDNGNLTWNKKIDISKSMNNWQVSASGCGNARDFFIKKESSNIQNYTDESFLFIQHDEIIKFGSIHGVKGSVQKKDVQLQIARTYAENKQLKDAIKEYNLLIRGYDQMNQDAYWEMANIYQKENNTNKAVRSLLNYYDLILPYSTAGINTIQKLKNLSVLKWKINVYWDKFDNVEMEVDNERVFLFLDNNIEAYRINSGALIWKRKIGNENNRIISAKAMNEKHLFFIIKKPPDRNKFYSDLGEVDFGAFKKATTYSLVAIEKRGGDVFYNVPLKITGDEDITWVGVDNDKLFIQIINQKKMLIFAYDDVGGNMIWEISREISNLYKLYDLKPTFYNGNLLLPLDNKIEYINSESGIVSGEYGDEDIEQIFSFNENSIHNNTMVFFTEDIDVEYVVVNLDKNVRMNMGPLYLDNPKLSSLINNIFIDVSSAGTVTAYKLSLDEKGGLARLWQENYNPSLLLTGIDKQNVYLMDVENYNIIVKDSQSGAIKKTAPLLWPGKKYILNNNNFIIESPGKLYLISL